MGRGGGEDNRLHEARLGSGPARQELEDVHAGRSATVSVKPPHQHSHPHRPPFPAPHCQRHARGRRRPPQLATHPASPAAAFAFAAAQGTRAGVAEELAESGEARAVAGTGWLAGKDLELRKGKELQIGEVEKRREKV